MNERKPRGYWNYETCKKLAKDCNTRSEMKAKNQQAYEVARKKKWLEVFFNDKTRNSPGFWHDYEACKSEAMKYDGRCSFAKGNSAAYKAAKRNNWLKSFFPNKKKCGLPSKYTYEVCKNIAIGCKSRSEFAHKCHQAWQVSKDNNWIDDFTWLRNISVFTDKIDTVYAYVFIEYKSVYIGRSINIADRDRSHRGLTKRSDPNKDIVYRFSKENNCEIPTITILKENITVEEGCELEYFYVEKYKKEGWCVLNNAPTGKGSSSVGNIGMHKHKIEEFLEIAKKYNTKTKFARGNNTWYNYGRRKGWLDKCTWFIPSSILYSKSNKKNGKKSRMNKNK